MPPKSTRNKNIGESKENICAPIKAKQQSVSKNARATRRPLSDKTNSTSDDNDPPTSELKTRSKKKINSDNELKTRSKKKINSNSIVPSQIEEVEKLRSRRNRKPPERFIENQGTKVVDSNKSVSKQAKNSVIPQKLPIVVLTPLKSFDKVVETNIADSRPKRICRLPSKFDNHSISPNKYIPVKPIQASTPIVHIRDKKIIKKINNVKGKINTNQYLQTITNNKTKSAKNKGKTKGSNSGEINSSENNSLIQKPKTRNRLIKSNNVIQKEEKAVKKNTISKKQPDTNNNANDSNNDRSSCTDVKKKFNKANRIINKDYSIKLFENRKSGTKRAVSNLDVYEFTFDPTEEPPPQKKKRKRTVRKKQEKSKPIFKNNYNKNVAKSLAALKDVLSKNPQTVQTKLQDAKPIKQTTLNKVTASHNDNYIKNVCHEANNIEENPLQQNFKSFHVEDIILDDQSHANDHDDINYSPIHSPYNVGQPAEPTNDIDKEVGANNDPLNLQDDLSFFDDYPAASSSLNVSTRNPSATPWRVEFGQLPIRWQVNTYVKPNMTPAFESSFINFDTKKKHVYTNMVPEENEALPEIIENETPSKLKQTSIISFFKEVVEKNANKKSKLKLTPVKENAIFDDIPQTSQALTPIKQIASVSKSITPKKNKSTENTTSGTDLSVSDKDNSTELQFAQSKSQNKKKNKDITYFGFDETTDFTDQENISPSKMLNKRHIRALRPRSRAILQEFNAQIGPIRGPIVIGSKKNENINTNSNFDEIKENNDQIVQEKAIDSSETTNNVNDAIVTTNENINQEYSQSVHLFEDLEVVHHVKPSRKSYGKAKKITFRQNSMSSDTQGSEVGAEQYGSSAEEDNLDDLTFQMPSKEPKKSRKKKKTKKQLSKKEKEVEAWAAGFNSMCEDIDHFDLIVE